MYVIRGNAQRKWRKWWGEETPDRKVALPLECASGKQSNPRSLHWRPPEEKGDCPHLLLLWARKAERERALERGECSTQDFENEREDLLLYFSASPLKQKIHFSKFLGAMTRRRIVSVHSSGWPMWEVPQSAASCPFQNTFQFAKYEKSTFCDITKGTDSSLNHLSIGSKSQY